MGYDIIDIGHMNSLIHTQIESYIGRGDGVAQDYDELNVDEQIAIIEPKLWNVIWTMTRSKLEVRGTSKLDDPTSQAHTDLSLPQTAGHTDLSLSLRLLAAQSSLSLRLLAAQSSPSLRLLAAQISLSPSDC